jgi:DNA-binding transcriptional LysR family regulator
LREEAQIMTRKAMPTRKPNSEYRTREHLLEREVEALIKAAKGNRNGLRDSTIILMMWRHGRSLSTLVQMVSAGIGVTLIPEMAVAVETRSASVSVARFKNPQPSRTIGMIWRKTSPLARQLRQISKVVCLSADALRKQHNPGSSSRNRRT